MDDAAGAWLEADDPAERWLRACALCGSVDADAAWPEPEESGHGSWHCSRCDAMRWLWVAELPGRRTG